MRTKKTLLNMAYNLGASLVILLLGLITRRLFVINFGDFIPGVATVVEKLFSFFTLAEFGVGSVISYRLYEQIAAGDNQKISRYMSMYRWAYRAIGLAILSIAAVCALFLPWIVGGKGADLPTAYTIYVLTLLSTLTSYFLATRRLMYTCTQQGYVCTRIDLCFNIALYLAKIVIALHFPNYILYFSATVILNGLANVVISTRYRRDFPEIRDIPVSLADFKELGLLHDLKYYLVHRLSDAIYGTSDSLVVSAVLGAGAVTPLGNYSTISDSATNIGNRILGSFAASIGNIVYDKGARAGGHDRAVFSALDLFSYLFASFVAVAYWCLFQPFIQFWMGGRYLLPDAFVLFFCLNEYVGWNHKMLGSYRAVMGRFEEDRLFMAASAILNLSLSFALVRPFGLPGVVAATVLAHSVMWAGRVKVVFGGYMAGGLRHYLGMQLAHAVTLGGSMAAAGWLCGFAPDGIAGLLCRVVIAAGVSCGINLAVYGRCRDAAYLWEKAFSLIRRLLGGEDQNAKG